MIALVLAACSCQPAATDTDTDAGDTEDTCRACPDTDTGEVDTDLADFVREPCDISVGNGAGRATCWSDTSPRGAGWELDWGDSTLIVGSEGHDEASTRGYLQVLDVNSDGSVRIHATLVGQAPYEYFGRANTWDAARQSAYGGTEYPTGLFRGGVYRFDDPLGTMEVEDASWKLSTTVPAALLGAQVVVGVFAPDGSERLAVSCENQRDNLNEPGEVFLVPLGLTGASDVEEVATARLYSSRPLDRAGNKVSAGGDVNADGFEDLVVGAFDDDPEGGDRGAAYIATGPFEGDVSLLDDHAVWIGEASQDAAGGQVQIAKDLDGDGYDDVLVGAWWNQEGGVGAGRAYVLHGPAAGEHSLAEADAWFDGTTYTGVGRAFADLGDFTGDGLRDFAVGAPGDIRSTLPHGRVYVFDGRATGALAATDALVIQAASVGDYTGGSLEALGDLDADGFSDLAIGAPFSDRNGEGSGAVYIVFGQAP